MPAPLDLDPEAILARVRERFGVVATAAEPLDLGDEGSRIFRVRADGGDTFLKLRYGPANEAGLLLPRFLADSGIADVVAPIPTVTGEVFDELDGVILMLYPFVDGASGGQAGMAASHWTRLGAALRGIHELFPPPEIAALIRTEDFAPPEIERARTIAARIDADPSTDPIERALAAFWEAHRDELQRVTERTAELAVLAATRRDERVICHADIHPWNVLIRPDANIAIVDWDDAKLAPRERDLMMIGIAAGRDLVVHAAFQAGYGPYDADPVLIAFFQYERLVQDLAVYGQLVFDDSATDGARTASLDGLMALFGPGGEFETATRSASRTGIPSD